VKAKNEESLMGWQLLAAAGIVGLAAAYLVRQTWRSWSGTKSGCGGGCGCASKPAQREDGTLISSEQLLSKLKQPK
jgi:hypothetical protein